jgi:putative hydrolase of the HAD superfamily
MIKEETTTNLIERIRTLSRPMDPIPTGLEPEKSSPIDVAAILIDVYGTMFISSSGDIGVREQTDNASLLLQSMHTAGIQVLSPKAGLSGVLWGLEEIRKGHEQLRGQGIQIPEVDIRQVWKNVLHKLEAEKMVLGTGDDEAIALLSVDYECRINPVWPMPGLKELLASLKERGIRMGIISNAQFFTPLLFPAFLEMEMNEIGFDPSLRVWSYAEGEAKPSPRLYALAAETLFKKYGIHPHQVLFVGNDILNDIRPAQQIGFKTALFAGDRRSLRLRENDPCCQDVKPDWVITELMQISQDLL